MQYNLPTEEQLSSLIHKFNAVFAVTGADGVKYTAPLSRGVWFWQAAEILEVVIDNYERFPTPENKTLVERTIVGFFTCGYEGMWQISGATRRKLGWLENNYNDDLMWITIAFLRAYKFFGDGLRLTGENLTLREIARRTFDDMFARAWKYEGGGRLVWCEEPGSNAGTNACIMYPATIAACLLAKEFGDGVKIRFKDYTGGTNAAQYEVSQKTYLETAKVLYSQASFFFRGKNGGIIDSINGWVQNPTTRAWSWEHANNWNGSYNLGTAVGSATMLYELTGDKSYIEQAVQTMKNSVENKYGGGVINDEANGNDLPGFKGILARWYAYGLRTVEGDKNLGKLSSDATTVREWLNKNAAAAWANRNDRDIMWTTWDKKTVDDMENIPRDQVGHGEPRRYGAFGCSTAVALLLATR